MSIEGKVALVTGATRGIGKAISLELAAAGAVVIGTATSEGGAGQITAALKEAGNAGTGLVLDVASQASVDHVFETIAKSYNAPTIVVNNAGITRDNLMLRMNDEEWNDVINTNLNSIFRVTRAALRGMTKARWGRVISISSVVGTMGNPGQTNYAAAKAGVEGFTRAMAREVGSRGITVNAVAPGFIDTDMTKELSEDQKNAMLGQIAVKRLGSPEEIASAVGFLSSDDAAYITGVTLHVNGGMYM